MECLLGMECDSFCLVAADMTNLQSFVILKNEEDKIYPLSEKLVMGVIGDAGDRAQFSQYIDKNLQLYKIRNQYSLSTAAAVHFTRRTLTDSFRSTSPFYVNLLVGGYDEDEGGQLYFLDLLGSCMRCKTAAHGFAGMFAIGVLNSQYRRGLTESEAYEVIKLCVAEIQKRVFLNLSNFLVKVVSKDSIKTLPIITPASFPNTL